MKQHNIAILAKKKANKTFLKNFFRGNKTYKPYFFETPDNLEKFISYKTPSVLLVEDIFIPSTFDISSKIPVIAIINENAERHINQLIKQDIKQYIIAPYSRKDLSYKLKIAFSEKEKFLQMEKQIAELQTINELINLITSTLDPREILYRIVKKISEIMPVTRCSIIRVDWLHKFAFVVASFEDPNIAGIKLNLKKYPEILHALTSRKPVVISDVKSDPLMIRVKDILEPLGIRSILVIPIIFREKVIGTLFLRTSRSSRAFEDSEIRLVNTIASASANALYNAFLFEQVEDEKERLEKLAITDYLTGIYNIRYFYHRIIEEFSRSQRYSIPMSCLMVDIDHFKKINDIYGHKIGDLILKEFAQQLKKCSRKSDVVARYGGEEFIFMLPQTSINGAIAEAERIRHHITNYRFKGLKKGSSITVSIGIASIPHPRIKSHDDLIAKADDALFRAKKNGRNQVVVYGKK